MRATFISHGRDYSAEWRLAVAAASLIVVIAAVCFGAYVYLTYEWTGPVVQTEEMTDRRAPGPEGNGQDAVDRIVAAEASAEALRSRVSEREFSAPIGVLHSLAAPGGREAATIQTHCEPTYASDARRPGSGVLLIQSSSPASEGSEVLLNGECQGTMSAGHLMLENIPAGTYEIVIRKGLHVEIKRTVRIPLRDRALEAAPKVVVNF